MRTTTSRPFRRGSAALATLALGGSLVLAGCGSDSDDSDDSASESSESAEPTDEPDESESAEEPEETESEDAEAGATAVEYDLPEDWEDVTEEVSQQTEGQVGGEIVSAARDSGAGGGQFADNVNIIEIPAAPGDNLDTLEQQALQQLEASGARDAETLERSDLDGEEAVRQSGVVGNQQAEYRVDQLITIRGDVGYVVTFSHNLDTSEADRSADIETVLDSIDFQD